MSIIDRLSENAKSNIYPFHMPGHKRRMYATQALKEIYKLDITEIDNFDDLHDASGIIKSAEEKAAKLYGTSETKFLINGSTSGILAAICATVKEGDIVIVARNCHKSVYNAVMLSGATPIYVYPKQEAFFEVNAGIDCSSIEEALEKCGNTADKNVLVVITSPTYEGIVSDIKSISDVCHRYNAQLLVDEAHGAHFGITNDFPVNAISCGADVVVDSVHKTLPALTQTALIHINDSYKAKERLLYMLTVFQSSSPSYILMSGIESCIDYIEANKKELFEKYTKRLNDFYKEVSSLNNISVLTKDKLSCEGSFDFDRSKLVISDKSGKLSGRQLYNILLATYELQPEMAAGSYVLLMTSIADDDKGFDRLKKALIDIDESIDSGQELLEKRSFFEKLYDRFIGRKISKNIINSLFNDNITSHDFINVKDINTTEVIPIKEALWEKKKEYIPVELSEGRISADFVMFYPPGSPIIAPGEMLTKDIVDIILDGIQKELLVKGLNDNKEIAVLWEKSSM